MFISSIFIRRPVATTLLTAGIALFGLLALNLLPVSPLPQVDFPTISVTASLPGASPETMAATVAAPLERTLGAIAGVNEMTSSSSLGSTRITLQFDLERDIDGAARDVQAALNAARTLLPTGMPSSPTYRKVNPADTPILILSLTSASMSRVQMYDAASTVLAQKIAQVEGVGQVSVGGGSLPAVRVQINPGALARAGVSVESVRAAIAAANVNRPKGALEDQERYWQVQANDQAKTAADYLPLIVSWRNGAAVRLADVATVRDAEQERYNTGLFDGKPAVMVVVFRQPGANIIDTVDRIKALLPGLRASIPAAIDLDVANDRTRTIRASLREVEQTLIFSVALVIAVVFIFLRDRRATLIPVVAVPVSLIGTFGVMYLAGFSLNNLSLMALTIATGFVVDDAVVVLENISRHIERGMAPFAAALQGAREVGFTVLSMSLSLIAVFIPILLMEGIVGRLFREFALTLSAAILISLLISLTTTPMMCARLLRARPRADAGGQAGGRERRGNDEMGGESLLKRGFDALHACYRRSLDWALAHGALMLLILAAAVGLNVYLYYIVPKGFFPRQDTGMIVGGLRADEGMSFQALSGKLGEVMEIIRRDPAVDHAVGFFSGVGGNFMALSLKPRAERNVSAAQVIDRLREKLARIPGVRLYLRAAQDIRIGGRGSNAQYQYTLQADTVEMLRAWEPRVRLALSRLKELTDVNTDQQNSGMQTRLVIDRDAMARLGLNQREVNATLNDLFGQRQISTIYHPLNQYRVVMEAAPEYTQGPENLKDVYFISASQTDQTGKTGQAAVSTLVPLSAFARWEMAAAPLSVHHQGQFVASTISFNLPPGGSLSQATAAIEQAMQQLGAPAALVGSFQGSARVFQRSLSNQPLLILAALVAVYIVLGMLYESLVHPLTILSTLPSAGVGALLALLAFRTEFSVIALIGVILLIGIVKKNAIMMIDFAVQAERQQGLDSRAAIREACLLRFRPIMMTTMAALFGALPLMLGHGDGAEMRQPLGISIVGGLLLSQLLTLYTTPVVYLYLDRWRLRRTRCAETAAGGKTP